MLKKASRFSLSISSVQLPVMASCAVKAVSDRRYSTFWMPLPSSTALTSTVWFSLKNRPKVIRFRKSLKVLP